MYWLLHPFIAFKFYVSFMRAARSFRRKSLPVCMSPGLVARLNPCRGISESINRLELLVDEEHVAHRLNTTADKVKAFASRLAPH